MAAITSSVALLDCMVGARDAAHLALPDFAMQPARLLKRQREAS
jgi:hypothetical protein